MDRKTMGLLVTEAILIVVLVVVIGMDFNKVSAEHGAAPAAVTEEKAAAGEEAPAKHEEPAAEKAEAKHEEAAAEKAEAKHEEAAAEKAEAKPEVKAEKPAKKEKAAEKAAPEAAKEEKPAEKAAAPAKSAEGGSVADVIAMECPAYPHTKSIVQFTHKKHIDEYKFTCGDCHHDEKGQPLKELKMGDPVMKCIECHSKPGKAPKPAGGEKLAPEQKREYHMEALHDNCIECHKEFNQKNNTKAAAVTCAQCHPGKK